VKVDPAKVKAVRNFPIPKKMGHIRSFLGIAGYYRKFIEQFADIVHALTQLTRSKVQWQWGTEAQKAFDKITELLCSAPVLAYPNFAQPFIIHTDACGFGVGGILSQIPSAPSEPESVQESIMDSKEHPIAYTSKHLNDLQIKWCTTEKEAYAIYHTVKTFFPYLFGTTFTIVTDHASLKYLMGKREPTGRLARWSLYLQQFDMEIHYRPGKLHQNADALSRCPVYAIVTPKFFVDDWIIAQQEDKFCKMLMEKQTGKERPDHFGEEDSFKILPSGLWATSREKIVVPMEFQKEIMVRYHDHKLAAHMGIEKTLANIRNKYFWPKMARDVRIHVTNCLICAKRKAAKACKAPLQPFPVAEYLWQLVAMDIVGPVTESYRGNKYILVLMEYVTRYVIAFPLKETTAQTIVKKFIKHVITKEGIPAQILTDQGSNFQSETMAELCKQLGTKQLRTTSYHPQTDGAVERFNQTLGNMLTIHTHNNPREWDEHLGYIVAAYNTTPHSSTGDTPFFLLKGRDAIEPTDLRPPLRNRYLEDQNNVYAQQWQEAIELAKANLIVAQARQKHYYDRNLQECSFEPNDVVLLKILKAQKGKFKMRWNGPYIVIEKLSNLNYLIRHQNDTYPVVVHVNRMRKWRGETTFNNKNSDTENENSNTDNEEPTTTTPTTPERENTAKSSTNDPENNENNATAGHQPTIANANDAIEPINGANTGAQQNTETTVENVIQTAPAETNEITTPVVLPEEPQGMIKRRRGRPRKNPTAPNSTIIPTPHTHNLLRFIRSYY
jgi:transposase InsO family protein